MNTADKLLKIHADLNAIIMSESADIAADMIARLEDAEEIINDVRNDLATTTP